MKRGCRWFPAAVLLLVFGCKDLNKSGVPEEDPIALHTKAVPENGGKVVPDKGEYDGQEEVELRAIPAEGFVFTEWSGDLSGTSNPYTLKMTEETAVVAIFTEKDDKAEDEPAGEDSDDDSEVDKGGSEGTEDDNGDSIGDGSPADDGGDADDRQAGTGGDTGSDSDDTGGDTGSDGKEGDSDDGDPDEGGGDSNGGIGDGQSDPESDPEQEFDPAQEPDEPEAYEIKTDVDGAGEIVFNLVNGGNSEFGDRPPFEHGTDVVVLALADEGWIFHHWEKEGYDNILLYGTHYNKNHYTEGAEAQSVTLWDLDRGFSIKAVFWKYFTVNWIAEEGGRIEMQRELGGPYFFQDEEVTLRALPDDGWRFSHWDGDVAGNSEEYAFTVDDDLQIVAVFEQQETHSIIVDVNQPYSGRIQINGEEYIPGSGVEYEAGSLIEVRAFPAPYARELTYLFHQWDGDIISEENPVSFTLDSDISLIPLFGAYTDLRTWTRSVDMVEGVGGAVVVHTPPARDGLYELGQEIEVEALPDGGWEFVEWDLSFSGTENPSIQLAGHTPGEAVFKKLEGDPVAGK